MLSFYICEAPQKISTIFKPILAIFTLFHLKNLLYLQKPELGNLAKTRFWLLLVNNSLCSIPLSYARSYIKQTPGDRCAPGRSTSRTTTRRRFECRNCSLPTFSTESSRDRHERYYCRELNAKVILCYVQWHIQQLIMSMTLTRSRSRSECEPHFTEAAF